MNMNGMEIDPESQEFQRRLLNLSTYPATLIHETMKDAASVYQNYILEDDKNHVSKSAMHL
jgi:hypothetical protein